MYDETSHNKGLKELLSSHTISELRELSLNTRDYNIQKMLSDCNTLEIRRNLAKNTNLNSDIANILACDTTVNVSYVATKNRNCTVKREFNTYDINHRCIICETDTHYTKCSSCNREDNDIKNSNDNKPKRGKIFKPILDFFNN